MSSSSSTWSCRACTFLNPPQSNCCEVCLTDRATTTTSTAVHASSSSSTAVPSGPDLATTPVLLSQIWSSHDSPRDVVAFSQRGSRWSNSTLPASSSARRPQHRLDDLAHPTFSNNTLHVPVRFVIPTFCNASALSHTGRSTTVTFNFAEQAIMCCKAALFQDWSTYDAIVTSTSAGEAKGLGRRVRPWDQRTWDRMICPITREVVIAKMNNLPALKEALLQTGDAWIAEASDGDWVWGVGLSQESPFVSNPGKWLGINVLGWALMEARDVARGLPSGSWQQQQQGGGSSSSLVVPPQGGGGAVDDASLAASNAAAVASASASASARSRGHDSDSSSLDLAKRASDPSVVARGPDSDSSTSSAEEKKEGASSSMNQSKQSKRRCPDEHSVEYITRDLSFGPEAFGPLVRTNPTHDHHRGAPDLRHRVGHIVLVTCPEAQTMRGERGRKPVTQMITDIYNQGLFMHGGPSSAVNAQVIPAMRLIFEEVNGLPPHDEKRIATIRALVEACQDCQQVQARVILRLYSDYTSQTETFDMQLKYSLVRQKEAALQNFLSNHHPRCDCDHTQVSPWQQRDHLISGYTVLIGERFGLDGIEAAKGDRFLQNALSEISTALGIHIDLGQCRIVDPTLETKMLTTLAASMSVKEWMHALIADVNNQADGAERLINRSCIFSWADAHMEGQFKHDIFYDESRSVEFTDVHPSKPLDKNLYEPFLSPRVLVAMLVKAGMLMRQDGK